MSGRSSKGAYVRRSRRLYARKHDFYGSSAMNPSDRAFQGRRKTRMLAERGTPHEQHITKDRQTGTSSLVLCGAVIAHASMWFSPSSGPMDLPSSYPGGAYYSDIKDLVESAAEGTDLNAVGISGLRAFTHVYHCRNAKWRDDNDLKLQPD